MMPLHLIRTFPISLRQPPETEKHTTCCVGRGTHVQAAKVVVKHRRVEQALQGRESVTKIAAVWHALRLRIHQFDRSTWLHTWPCFANATIRDIFELFVELRGVVAALQTRRTISELHFGLARRLLLVYVEIGKVRLHRLVLWPCCLCLLGRLCTVEAINALICAGRKQAGDAVLLQREMTKEMRARSRKSEEKCSCGLGLISWFSFFLLFSYVYCDGRVYA